MCRSYQLQTQLHIRFVRTLLLVASVLLGLLPCESVLSQVVISEIMYNPDGADIGTGFNREWVEIYNSGAASVDLSGWVFEDFQDMTPADSIPNGTMIGAGEALVLVGDAQAFDSQWGTGINRLQLGNFPSIANSPSATNEILLLRDNLSVVRDQVNYDDANGWPTDSPDGPSIFTLPGSLTALANNDGANWHRSTFGVYGAYLDGSGEVESTASPGIVATQTTSFDPSPDAAWSMVVFPDTQNYVKSQTNQPIFVDMAEWVRDNRATWNIQAVLHEGDIVNKNSNENPSSGENPSTLQWQNARAAMSILDGEVPTILAAGNHDYGINNAEDRTTRLNDFFSASDNSLVDPAQGGILKGVLEPGHLENAYYELTAPDGRELLIFSLGWDPQSTQLTWANQIAGQAQYDNHTAMLLTHAYLNKDSERDSQGETFWDELVNQNDNFEITFNGHFSGNTGYLASATDAGNIVHQMFVNSQFEVNGGNGWIRVLEFLDDGKTVRVRTYSPFLDFVRTDPENDFSFEISPLLLPELDGDYNNDGIVDAADYTVWLDNVGSTNALHNDNNLGTPVGQLHSDLWKANFGSLAVGNASTQGGPTIPEPATVFLVAAFLIVSLTDRLTLTIYSRFSFQRIT